MATEGYVKVERLEDFDDIEARLKSKYTWTSITEVHLVRFAGIVVAYARGGS